MNAGIKAEFGFKANPKMGDQLNHALEQVGTFLQGLSALGPHGPGSIKCTRHFTTLACPVYLVGYPIYSEQTLNRANPVGCATLTEVKHPPKHWCR